MHEREILSHASIDDWGRRVSAARARLRSDIRDDQLSPPTLEGAGWLEDLTLALEELQVAEEELHVQTEELSTSRALLEAEQARYRTLFEQAPVADRRVEAGDGGAGGAGPCGRSRSSRRRASQPGEE